MVENVVRPAFAGSNLIASLEHALQMARDGELVAVVLIGAGRDGEFTIGGMSGDDGKLPLMSALGELEHQKQMLLEKIER